jgi:hypothetical protein
MDILMVTDIHGFDERMSFQNRIHHADKACRVGVAKEGHEHASLPVGHHGSMGRGGPTGVRSNRISERFQKLPVSSMAMCSPRSQNLWDRANLNSAVGVGEISSVITALLRTRGM